MNIETNKRFNTINGKPESLVSKLQVTNQKANASRALDAKQQYALSIKHITQSLFGFEYLNLIHLIVTIINKCDFEAMCMLRLVAKGFYALSLNACDYLTTDTNHKKKSPFLKKAVVSFKCADIDTDVIKCFDDKIKFVKTVKPEVNFVTTLDEIDDLLVNELFLKNQSTITLKATSTDLDDLIALSATIAFSGIAPKIKKLDISKITITEDNSGSISGLLTTVFQKCNCLKSLFIGDINIFEEHALFRFPDFCDSLTELFVGTIHSKMIMLLPHSCNNLKAISIKNIYPKSLTSLSSESNNLLNCTIGNIWKDVLLILPKSIISLFIKEINQDVIFELPESVECPNLVKLTINKIGSNAKLNLEKSLKNLASCLILKEISNNICFNLSKSLTNLFIQKIWKDDRIKLAALNIKSLIINEIQGNVVLELPSSLLELAIDRIGENVALELETSLTKLTIGIIVVNATLNLPNTIKSLSIGEASSINQINVNSIPSLPNELQDFSIGKIDSDSLLKLPTSLKNLFIGQICFRKTLNLSNLPPDLTHLTIGKMLAKSKLKLPDQCNQGLTLTINSICNEVDLKLPDSLGSLVIKKIGNSATLKLPSSLKNLKSFSIGHIGHKAIIELPGSMNQLSELSIENNTTFQLFSKFGNLTKITIKNLPGQFKLPPQYCNLKSFFIGSIKINNDENNIDCDLNSLSGLTNLSIEYIEYGANFELLGTYHSLKTLTLGTIAGKNLLKLKSLDKLETLVIGNLERNVVFEAPLLFTNLKMLSINGHQARLEIENEVKKFIFAAGTLSQKPVVFTCPRVVQNFEFLYR